MKRYFKEYITEEIDKSITGQMTCSWGDTTKAKALEDCVTDGHTHRFVIDSFGYGKTSMSTDNGYTHWHLITENKIQNEGNHSHEIGKVKGKCNSINNISVDGELSVVGV